MPQMMPTARAPAAGRRSPRAGDGVFSGARGVGFCVLAILAGLAGTAQGRVVRWQIDSREPFADGAPFGPVGPYERITGRMHAEVDPEDPANARIVDLRLAPRNARGKV